MVSLIGFAVGIVVIFSKNLEISKLETDLSEYKNCSIVPNNYRQVYEMITVREKEKGICPEYFLIKNFHIVDSHLTKCGEVKDYDFTGNEWTYKCNNGLEGALLQQKCCGKNCATEICEICQKSFKVSLIDF